ncbi:MAG: ribosomal subunit interface protein [Anaerolineae bacterium UTCFX2]|nr:ribosome-associated translation inhibitor RaiA [Anaerolineae bacterium]MCZ7553243.1 ribosome-associated translation inhibitor RaiA [Anaerolineales bacterium]OQY93692.1 MAG: ribosomal subunit interface protein [Anaerolineae bacterium UTCFX2]
MALEVDLYTRNMDVTDRIQDYVNKKFGKLDRYLPDIEEARVDLSYVKSARSSTDRQVAQVTVRGKGFILRAEERADDIFAAMDTAMDKMQRQIERYKGKRNKGRGDGKSAAEVVEAPLVEEESGEEMPLIVRRKAFQIQPMDELEALEQMQLLGHESFFIFFNVNTNSINVLYRRRDGAYGLIEPLYG